MKALLLVVLCALSCKAAQNSQKTVVAVASLGFDAFDSRWGMSTAGT